MFGKKQQQIDEMHRLLHAINTALIVREPGTARSVEAYEGLRKTVATAMKERRQHLAQLINFADAIDAGATIDTLEQRVEEWLMEAGLSRWERPTPLEYYEILDGEGEGLEVLEPAWVELSDGMASLVKPGRARRIEASSSGSGSASDVPAPDDPSASAPAADVEQAVTNTPYGGPSSHGDATPEEMPIDQSSTRDTEVDR